MTPSAIETERLAGEITLVLMHGTEDEKESLLTAIEQAAGIDERLRIEGWMREGFPDPHGRGE